MRANRHARDEESRRDVFRRQTVTKQVEDLPLAVRQRDRALPDERQATPGGLIAELGDHACYERARHGGLAFKQIDPTLQQFLASLVCLALFTGARVCEQVRAGIQSLPPGQKNAGLALGLTLAQTYRYVLVPMAARRIVPPLTSETLNIFKNSAVCSTIGLLELAAQGRQLVEYTAQPYESFIAVTVLYLVINALVMVIMRQVEKRTRIPGFIGSEK